MLISAYLHQIARESMLLLVNKLHEKRIAESQDRRNFGRHLSLIQTSTTPCETLTRQIFIQVGRRTGQEQTDTTKPMTISEEEELERITSLLQRDNLIRGLGVVEFVYKLLHCTPGTGGPQKNCSLHHSVSYKRNHLKGNVTPLLKEIGKD